MECYRGEKVTWGVHYSLLATPTWKTGAAFLGATPKSGPSGGPQIFWSNRATHFKAGRRPFCPMLHGCTTLRADVRVSIEQSLPGNLSPSDWADLRELLSAIQQAMPDAAQRSPGEVFQMVRDALGKPEGNSVTETVPAGK